MVKQEYIDLLKLILTSMQVTTVGERTKVAEAIKVQLHAIKEMHEETMFWEFLYGQYGAYPNDLKELLKYLYDLTGDRWFASWLLDMVFDEQFEQKNDYFLLLQLEIQRQIQYFQLYRKLDMKEQWEINSYFKQGYQEYLGMEYPYIPVEERNRDCIVIATTQFGGIKHAPTRFVLEICYAIQKYLNKRVLLLCEVERTDATALLELGLRGLSEKRYNEDLNGWFKGEYRGVDIEGYQILLEENTKDEQKELMDAIYGLKPLCVWNFGGTPVFSSAMQRFTSVFYTLMNQGYPAVPVDVVVNYFKGSALNYPEQLEFLREHGVAAWDMIFTFPRPEVKGILKRVQFQIPEQAFVLAIAGNRLEKECTEEFLQVMRQVLDRESEMALAFIGNVEAAVEKRIKEFVGAENRCYFLGYQDELEEVMVLADLYVDLPHQGGGTVGIAAMNAQKPLLCLRGGDVSSAAGEGFCYEALEEYEDAILRYKNDAEYYKQQSQMAKERLEDLVADDAKLATLIEEAIEWGIKQH